MIRNERKNTIDATIYVTSELRHSPFLYAGLKVLQKENYLESLKLIPECYYHKDRVVINGSGFKRINRPYPFSIRVLLRDQMTRKKIMLGFDLQDWDHMFSHHCLKQCQIIYKRAYRQEMIDIIKKIYGNVEIKPFGFTHKIDLDDKKILLISKISQILNRIPYALFDSHRFKQFILKKFKRTPQISGTISSDSALEGNQLTIPPDYPFIFYQVEYHHWPGSNEAETLNERRAKLIRLLKNEFGKTFIGGMFFRNAPNDKFIDCQTNVPYDQEIYLSFVKKATVVISTNGFGYSFPWKLAEYMKYGCCIITEELVHKIEPLIIKGLQVEIFKTDQECLKLCGLLLTQYNKIGLLKKNSKLYYEDNINPDKSIYRHFENIILK